MQVRPPEGPPVGWTHTPRTRPPDHREAACDDHPDPDRVLFPDDDRDRNAALDRWDEGRALCDGCPVRVDCLDYALTVGERFGMWGGLTPAERGRLARTIGMRPSRSHLDAVPHTRHGTRAGYLRHRRLDEDACQPCLDAHNAYTSEAPPAGKRGRRLPRSEIVVDRRAG